MGEIRKGRRMDAAVYEDSDGDYRGGGPARVWFEDGRELQVVLVAGVNPRVFCAICGCLPQRANLMRCGNILCDRCVGRYTFLMERPCPCGKGGTWDCGNPFRYRLDDHQLNELMVECPNLPDGCEVFVPLMDLDRHQKECTKGPVSVPKNYDRQLFECVVSMVENVCLALNVGLERDMETNEEQIAAFINAPLCASVDLPSEEPTMVLTEVCSVAPEDTDDVIAEKGNSSVSAGKEDSAKTSLKGKALKREKRVTKASTASVAKQPLKFSPPGHAHRLKEIEVLYTDEGVLKLLESGVTGRTRQSRKVAGETLMTPTQSKVSGSDDSPMVRKNTTDVQPEKNDLALKVVIERINPDVGGPRTTKRDSERRGLSRELQALLAAQEEAGEALIKPESTSRRDKSLTPLSSEDKNRSMSPELRKYKIMGRKSARNPQGEPLEDESSDEQDGQEDTHVAVTQQRSGRSQMRQVSKLACEKKAVAKRSKSSEAVSSGRAHRSTGKLESDEKCGEASRVTASLSYEDSPASPKLESVQRMRSRSQAPRARCQESNELSVEPKTAFDTSASEPLKPALKRGADSTVATSPISCTVSPLEKQKTPKEKTKANINPPIQVAHQKEAQAGSDVEQKVPSSAALAVSDETGDEVIPLRNTRSRSRVQTKVETITESDSPLDVSPCEVQTLGQTAIAIKKDRGRSIATKASVKTELQKKDSNALSVSLKNEMKIVKKNEESQKPVSLDNQDGHPSLQIGATSTLAVSASQTTDKSEGADKRQSGKKANVSASKSLENEVDITPKAVCAEHSKTSNQQQENCNAESVFTPGPPKAQPASAKPVKPESDSNPATKRVSVENEDNGRNDPRANFRPSGPPRDPRRAAYTVSHSDIQVQQGSDSVFNTKRQSKLTEPQTTSSISVIGTSQKHVDLSGPLNTNVSQDLIGPPIAVKRVRHPSEERIRPNTFKIPKRSFTETPQDVGSPVVLGSGPNSDNLSWEAQSSQVPRTTSADNLEKCQQRHERQTRWNSPGSSDSSGSRASRKEDVWSYGAKPDVLHHKRLSLQSSEAQYASGCSPRVSSDSRDLNEFHRSKDRNQERPRERSYSPRPKKRDRSSSSPGFSRNDSHLRSRSRPSRERRPKSGSRYREDWNYGPRRHDERVPVIRYVPSDRPSCSREYYGTYSKNQQERTDMREVERFTYTKKPIRDDSSIFGGQMSPDLLINRQVDQGFPFDTLCREIPVEPRMVIRLPERKPSVRPVRCVIELPRPVFVPEGQGDKAIVERESIQEIFEPRKQTNTDSRTLSRDPRFYRRNTNTVGVASGLLSAGSSATSNPGPPNVSMMEMSTAVDSILRQLGHQQSDTSSYAQWTHDRANCRSLDEQRATVLRYWTHYVAAARQLSPADHQAHARDGGGFSGVFSMPSEVQQNQKGSPRVYDQSGQHSSASTFVGRPELASSPHVQPEIRSLTAQPPRLGVQSNILQQRMYSQRAQSQHIDAFAAPPAPFQLVEARVRPGDTRAPTFSMDGDSSRFSDDDDLNERNIRRFKQRSRSRDSNSRWLPTGATHYRSEEDQRSRH